MANDNSFWGNSLFSPAIVSKMVQGTGTSTSITLDSLSGANVQSTSSYDFEAVGAALKSTQQIPLDWSKFKNHTFFDSAESKINVAFDTIINYFPFDGTKEEIETFIDTLSGFEKYVFDRFPRSKGFLHFSGTQKGEDPGSGYAEHLGTHIVVQDQAGALYPSISRTASGNPVLDPGLDGLSLEFYMQIPAKTNDNQIIMQKLSGSAHGITLALSQSSSTNKCDLIFLVSSGSSALVTTASFTKGAWRHVAAVFDRKASILSELKLYVSGVLRDTSATTFDMNYIDFSGSPLRIGSGSEHGVGALSGLSQIPVNLWKNFIPQTTFSGALDELKVYKGYRGPERIYNNMDKTVFPSSGSSPLKLYYKFNEATGSYPNNSVVLDSSGNSLHSKIANYSTGLREKKGLKDPLAIENPIINPVLFPAEVNVVNLNIDLMASGTYYDANNPNLITKLIPNHYLVQDARAQGWESSRADLGELYSYNIDIPGGGKPTSVQIISSILFTWARLFDQIKIYMDHFGKLLTIDYEDEDTISNQLLNFFANYYGFTLPNQFSNSSPEQYLGGENLNNEAGISENSLKFIQSQIWRRILVNMQEIIRSKGTIHSIKAIMRASGINPDNLFRFREFGGSRFISTKDSRSQRTEVSSFLKMTGSTTTIQSPYMSGSRIEVGYPFVTRGAARGALTVASSASISAGNYLTFTDVKGNTLGLQFGGTVPRSRIDLDFLGGSATTTQIAFAISNALTASSADGTKLYGITGSAVGGRVNLTQSVDFGASGNTTIDATSMGAGAITPIVNFTGGAGFSYANNAYPPHGISTDVNDGLFTTGSWTYEALYNFKNLTVDSPDIMTQSLVRMFATGSAITADRGALLMNVIAYGTGSGIYQTGSIVLFARPNWAVAAPTLRMELTGVNVFDKNSWHVSFGRNAGNATSSFATSSYFFRVGRQSYGSIVEYHQTSSIFLEGDVNYSTFQNINSSYNVSGTFFIIGSGTIGGSSGDRFLQATTQADVASYSIFNGNVARMRFWSNEMADDEDKEHVRNFQSVGVNDPTLNFNFVTKATGSFERMRFDVHCDQIATKSNGTGLIDLFDFSQNNLHWSGSNFAISSQILNPHQFDYSILDAKFDERSAENKVRIWSFEQQLNMKEFNTLKAPVTTIPLSYPVTDDTRFSIEISCVQALNDDMINLLATLDFFDKAIGNPELMFADGYPKLISLREVYFNRLVGQVNYKNLFEFYKWFDDSLAIIIERLIPRSTKFLGINFVIESHLLERAKMRYLQADIYLGENDRRGLGGDIFLQQIVGSLKRY